MWRRALTYQLILAVAVGPLLCCCTVGKSLAGSPSTTPLSAPAPAPAERISHSCCAHKHRTPAKTDHDQKPAPAKPGQPAEKCPCKDGASKTQLTQAESTQADISAFLRSLTFDTLIALVSPTVSEVVRETSGLDADGYPRHVLSPTDELLYAHHNLRC